MRLREKINEPLSPVALGRNQHQTRFVTKHGVRNMHSAAVGTHRKGTVAQRSMA